MGKGGLGKMLAHTFRIVSSVEFALRVEGPADAACAVSGKGRAGLSTFPFGLSGMRFKGTNTTEICQTDSVKNRWGNILEGTL